MLPVFGVLAKLKFLRGTSFDVFGISTHRKHERALIVEYRDVMREVFSGLNEANYGIGVEIASYPERIRGYDIVKDASLENVRIELAAMRSRFTRPRASSAEQIVAAE